MAKTGFRMKRVRRNASSEPWSFLNSQSSTLFLFNGLATHTAFRSQP